jgi:hypothetical protein
MCSKGKYYEEYKTLFRTDISTRHTVALYWVPGHAGVRRNEIAESSEEAVVFKSLLDLSRSLGSLGRILKTRQTRWVGNQQSAIWRGSGST